MHHLWVSGGRKCPIAAPFFSSVSFNKYFRTFLRVIGLTGALPYGELLRPVLDTIASEAAPPSKLSGRAIAFATLEVSVFLAAPGGFLYNIAKY